MAAMACRLHAHLCGIAVAILLASSLAAAALQEPLLIQQVGGNAVDEDPDLITSLPGAPPVPFAMRSGYITVDEAHGRALFYWLVEADVPDPDSAPLTLWLNGGPGCSSIGGGMLSELGPYFPNKDGKTLQVNPHSWNKVSNLLFLESPAGVGFSYSNTSADYKTGDQKTAADSYIFLVKFFQQYPKYASSSFYITGESYAGHYVPQLAQLIVQKNKEEDLKVNLKGVAIGNAWTDADVDNQGAAFFWWSHALLSDKTFFGIVEACNFSSVGPLLQKRDECSKLLDKADRELGQINIYEIYVDVCISPFAKAQTRHFAAQLSRTPLGGMATRPLLQTADGYDPCVDDEVEAYLNIPEVQRALHANTTGLRWKWTDCSYVVHYSWQDVLTSIIPVYRDLLDAKLQILIYSGDTDAIVPVTGSRKWISTLGLNIAKDWRPYYVDRQVGGYVTVYDGLTFATVRGAGHMVPYTQPARGLHLFRSFVQNTAL